MDEWLDRFKGHIIVALVALVAAGGGPWPAPARPPAPWSSRTPAAHCPPSSVTISVHVSGAVASPGVYSLPLGDRVEDAMAAAGGVTADGNPNALNLAARLVDGQQVRDSQAGEPAPVLSRPRPPAPRLISINSGSLAELDTLPGIGQVTGQKIIDFRNKNGPFQAGGPAGPEAGARLHLRQHQGPHHALGRAPRTPREVTVVRYSVAWYRAYVLQHGATPRAVWPAFVILSLLSHAASPARKRPDTI